MTFTADFVASVDLTDPLFLRACLAIVLQPLLWHAVARHEYNTKFLSRLTGSAQIGVHLLSAQTMIIGSIRNIWVDQAIKNQPQLEALDNWTNAIVAIVVMLIGFQFVATSLWALGWNGTFLGDYFGFLMSARITHYPYNVLSDPMYVGWSLVFLGHALGAASPIGFVLAAVAAASYVLVSHLEGPFTAAIYANAAAQKKA